MLLDKQSLTTDIADSAENGRYTLRRLAVFRNGSVLSTNGTQMLYVPPVPGLEPQDMPKIDGVAATWTPETDGAFGLEPDDAARLRKMLSAGRKARNPALSVAQVDGAKAGVLDAGFRPTVLALKGAGGGGDDMHTLPVERMHEAVLDATVNNDKEPVTVTMSLDLLIESLQALKAASRRNIDPVVTLRFYLDDRSPRGDQHNMTASTEDGVGVLQMGIVGTKNAPDAILAAAGCWVAAPTDSAEPSRPTASEKAS